MIFYKALPEEDFGSCGSNLGYFCVCATMFQALYWGITLGTKRAWKKIIIQEIEVSNEVVVEDCVGHYSFEYAGVRKPAYKVNRHAHDRSWDGEVNLPNWEGQYGKVVFACRIGTTLADVFGESFCSINK